MKHLCRRSFGWILVCLFLIGPCPELSASELILRDDFHALDHWKKTSGVSLARDSSGKEAVEIRSGHLFGRGLQRDLPVTGHAGKYVVVKSRLRGEELEPGNKHYKKAKVRLTFHGRDGSDRHESENFSGTFLWRYSLLQRKIPPDAARVVLHLRNESDRGSLYLDQVEVFVCEENELSDFDYPEGWPEIIAKAPRLSAAVRLDDASWVQLKRDLYGFNGFSFLLHQTGNVSMDRLLKMPELNALKPRIVRFPGGILANHYHWDTDGFDPLDLELFPAHDSPGRRKKYAAFGAGKGKFGFEDFAAWAKGRSVAPVLVLNVVSIQDPVKSADFVRLASSKGLEVGYAELGNELNLEDQRGTRMRRLKDYVAAVRPVIQQLRKSSPKTKIGIPLTEFDSEWNRKIKDAALDFDACVIHPYVKGGVSSAATIEGDRLLFGYAKKELPDYFSRLKQEFPGKAIWVSEWNVSDLPFRKRSNSLAGVVFAANTLMTMLREPAVDMACYHTLFGKETHGLNLIRLSDAPEFEKSAAMKYPYFFWRMVGEIFAKTDRTAPLSPVSAQDGTPYLSEHLRIQAFRNLDAFYLMVVNDGPSPVDLKIQALGKEVAGRGWVAISPKGPMGGVWAGRNDPEPVQAGQSGGVIRIEPLSVFSVGPIPFEQTSGSQAISSPPAP